MNRGFDEKEIEEIVDSIPAGRMGSTKEVADAVWQLIECPDYMTGQVITLDGGWT